MNKNTTCSECGGSMQEGYVLDVTKMDRLQSSWIEGKPEKEFWLGLNLEDRLVLPISAFRCKSCGFLKFYADPNTAPKE